MIPLLLKPRLFALKNRWFRRSEIKNRIGKDVTIALFSGSIMFFVFDGTSSLLDSLSKYELLRFHPRLLLGLFFAMLLTITLFSCFMASLHNFFLSRDLDLLLAAPLSVWTFFSGKMAQVIGSSTWMILIFAVPLLAAFGLHYQAPPFFYIYSASLIGIFILIPASLAVTAVTLSARIFPMGRTRFMFLLLAVSVSGGILVLIQQLFHPLHSPQNMQGFLRVTTLLAIPQQPWLPSHWLAVCIGTALESGRSLPWVYMLLLTSTAVAITSLAYITLRHLYSTAYAQAQQSSHHLLLENRIFQRRLRSFTSFLNRPLRALWTKELKLITRDFGQALQLMLLIGICFIYLYNFKFLRGHPEIPENMLVWWRDLLILANVCLGSFVVSAVCARFVYPAVSLEGNAFWLVASAPLSPKEYLLAKFRIWVCPIAAITAVIFISGAFAIDAPPYSVAMSAVFGVAISYGLTGIGIGLGALFADFQWEHPTQLTASLGALLYMLSGLALVCFNLLPATLLVFLNTLNSVLGMFPGLQCITAGACTLLLILWLNYNAARWALRVGEQALLRMQRQ